MRIEPAVLCIWFVVFLVLAVIAIQIWQQTPPDAMRGEWPEPQDDPKEKANAIPR